MDVKKIVLIVHKEDQSSYDACMVSVQALQVPNGYTLQTFTVTGTETTDYGVIHEKIYSQTLAKYYVSIDSTICFVNDDFLVDMLNIFQSDLRIGALGVAGAKSLPLSGNWQDAVQKFGGYYYVQDGQPVEKRFTDPAGRYEMVQGIDPILLAMQMRVPYQEMGLSVGKAAAWRQGMAMGIQQAGGMLVVPRQTIPWCLYSGGESVYKVDAAWLKKFAGYLSVPHDTGNMDKLLYRFGQKSMLGTGYRLDTPEGIAVGNRVRIGKDAWLGLPYANFTGRPRIELGDDCDLGSRCTISAVKHVRLERGVSTGKNVRIADYGPEYTTVGIPLHQQGADCQDGEVVIGVGTRLGANTVLEGNVHIGRGCLIEPNSLVKEDIPDYCVAMGNPARVIRMFEPSTGRWQDIKTAKEMTALLEQRRTTRPLLTIGIPTYNRAYYLNKCLQHIFASIGADSLFEVCILDNDSIDDTAQVADHYMKQYPNLHYEKNAENIGGAKNFIKAWQSGRGEYVVAMGDDDYLNPVAFYEIIRAIYEDRSAGLIALAKWDKPFQVQHYRGINDYVRVVSYGSTSISSIIYRREDFAQVSLDSLDKYLDGGLQQVAIQMEILHNNDRFALIIGDLVDQAGESNEGFYLTGDTWKQRKNAGKLGDFGRIFIKNYLDILNDYQKYGINEENLQVARESLLNGHIIPFFHYGAENPTQWQYDTVLTWYDTYYKQDAYYQEKRQELLAIKQQS